MSDDYLWNRSGTPDPDIKQLEELLVPLAHDAPFDEVRGSRVRKRELARATAHEPDHLVIVDQNDADNWPLTHGDRARYVHPQAGSPGQRASPAARSLFREHLLPAELVERDQT